MSRTPTSILCLFILCTAADSVIEFLASPDNIRYPMTSSLSLTCAVKNGAGTAMTQAPPGNGIIGRRRRSADTTTSGSDVIKHITAITISQNGVAIATVSLFTPAHAEPGLGLDLSNFNVTGDVTSGDQGHLKAVWDFPSANQSGEFACDVDGVTENGHSVHFTRDVNVKTVSVNIDDILAELHDLKKLVHDQQITIATQEKMITDHGNEIKTEKSRNDDLHRNFTSRFDFQEKTIAAQQNAMTDLQTQLTSHQQQLTSASHVETGFVKCGHSSGWHDGSYNGPGGFYSMSVTKSVKQNFRSPYSKPPVVFLSVVEFSGDGDGSSHTEDWYATTLEHVDTQGFRLRCECFSDYPVDDMVVSWISFSG